MEHPIRLTVPFGEIEKLPKLSPQKYEALLQLNRDRYSMKSIMPAQFEKQVAEVDLENPNLI
jgi:hypothetical protein